MIHERGTVKTTVTFLAGLALVVLSVVPTVVAAGITARLQHSEIPVDRGTRLMVSLSGTSSGQPEMPKVPGLRFIPSGTSSQMQFVNGQMSSAVDLYLSRAGVEDRGLHHSGHQSGHQWQGGEHRADQIASGEGCGGSSPATSAPSAGSPRVSRYTQECTGGVRWERSGVSGARNTEGATLYGRDDPGGHQGVFS